MHADVERPPLASAARVAAVVVAIDAGTKAIAATHLADRDVSLAGPLSLALTYNDTFARGLDLGAYTAPATFALTLAFVLLVAVACQALARVHARAPLALGLVGGAALANAADFAHTGRGAVDFLAVAARESTVVFNLADVAAYVGVVLLAGTAVALCRAIAAERHLVPHASRSMTAASERAVEPRGARRPASSYAALPYEGRVPLTDVARPVPVFAEPSAGVRRRDDGPSLPPAPPLYPPVHLPFDDAPVDVAPSLHFER